MNENITFALYGVIGVILGLVALNVIEFLVGGFGLMLISLVIAIYVGRKIYADLFGDL